MTLVYGAGGPYADLADMHSGLHERDRAFSCDEFVDHVVELASRATTAHPSARARRRFVAEALLDRYVRRIRVLGVDVRTVIAGRAAPAGAQADAVPPGVEVAGFKRTLVAGGQGGEALSHLAAAAAAVLLGKPYLVWLASAFDWLQGFVRRDRAQARAEIAGNRCGERLGTELGRSMLEPESGDALRSRLLRCVCADREA